MASPAFRRPMTPQYHHSNAMPPITRAVVKTFSIDKLRPICPVCNPEGAEAPYKNNNQADSLENHTSCQDSATDLEVQRLNSELDELQKCLLNGAAALAQAELEQNSNQDLN